MALTHFLLFLFFSIEIKRRFLSSGRAGELRFHQIAAVISPLIEKLGVHKFFRYATNKYILSCSGRANVGRRFLEKAKKFQRRIAERWIHVKSSRVWAVLAILYIVLWCYSLIVWYHPWEVEILAGKTQTNFPENIFVAFTLLGLIPLPGAFYVVWRNLLSSFYHVKT